jgi:hypothetical protein
MGLVCWRTWSRSSRASGSWGAINGETTARRMKRNVMVAPTRNTGLRRSRRQALAMRETPGASSMEPASSTATAEEPDVPPCSRG